MPCLQGGRPLCAAMPCRSLACCQLAAALRLGRRRPTLAAHLCRRAPPSPAPDHHIPPHQHPHTHTCTRAPAPCRPGPHLLCGRQRQAARRGAHQRAARGEAGGPRRAAQVWDHGCVPAPLPPALPPAAPRRLSAQLWRAAGRPCSWPSRARSRSHDRRGWHATRAAPFCNPQAGLPCCRLALRRGRRAGWGAPAPAGCVRAADRLPASLAALPGRLPACSEEEGVQAVRRALQGRGPHAKGHQGHV